jgi:hypothetical protein
VKLLAAGLLAACGVGTSRAAVVGYWRNETDTDASGGLSVPNEVGSGSPLVAAAASLAPEVPVTTIPQTGLPNATSLNGDQVINGSIAAYPALNTGSVTVEFWARTLESAGYLIGRTTGQSNTAIPTTITDGYAVENFNAVRVRYAVDNGAGGTTQVTLTPATAINLDTPWVHIAWTYNAATGVGNLYADGTLVATNAGTPGAALVQPAAQSITVGGDMDGGTLSSGSVTGIFDELRISDTALPPTQFLNSPPVPEPAGGVALLGVAGLLGARRRTRT